MRIRSTVLASAAFALLLPTSVLCAQQQGSAPIAPATATGQGAAPTWTTDQLLTTTVHQAWLMSGRNEATFFEMVTQLAEVSARNRNLQLPEDASSGQQVGEMIKTAAKQDTDQLLFAVVDAAVRKVGKPLATTGAGTSAGSGTSSGTGTTSGTTTGTPPPQQ